MKMEKKSLVELYVTPESTCIEIQSEGVLCGSVPPGGSEDGILGDDL